MGYGFDKVLAALIVCWLNKGADVVVQVSHSAELNAAGYSFFVMPDTFIIHAEHGVPRWRGKGDFVRLCLFPLSPLPPFAFHLAINRPDVLASGAGAGVVQLLLLLGRDDAATQHGGPASHAPLRRYASFRWQQERLE